ncbi:MAG TPA: porin [Acidobacteriota bacterium]|jgi:hypothetical protein
MKTKNRTLICSLCWTITIALCAATVQAQSPSTEELLAIIKQLEGRIKDLESKKTNDTAGGVEPAKKSETAPAAGPQVKDDKSINGVLAFFNSTELTGFVDAYYGYNFNKPTGDAQLRNFDTKHNQFALNLAEIALEKKPTPERRLGFRMDMDFGPATDIVHSAEPGGVELMKHFQQGYLSYLAPVGKGLQIDVGKFVTQHGAEVIETKDNWNYSRSLLFALAIPYYHMGARATYALNDKVAVAGFVVNGWNDVVDNNNRKTFGFQATLKPTAKLSITQNYMVGADQPKNDHDIRNLWDTTVTYNVSPAFSLMGNYDYGIDRASGAQVHWQGFAGYARFQPNKWYALSPRFEWYDDHDGFTTGTKQILKEFTLTSEQKINNGLVSRFEYRRDLSDTPFFTRIGKGLVKSQSTVTVGLFYAFSSRAE